MSSVIRLAHEQELEEVLELLNKATQYLHKKGIQQWAYPWEAKEILEDIKNNFLYVLIRGNVIIGTFAIKDIDTEAYSLVTERSKYLYRISILPECFGQGLGIKVVDYAIRYAKDMNKTLYLDCWAGNSKLRSFYSKAGFKHLGDIPEEDYLVSVFRIK